MKFSEIIGHSQLKDSLKRTISSARIPHSQLFVGDSGRGSLSLAIAYVQRLLCKRPTGGDACGECSNCYNVQRLEHPDLHFIFPTNASPHVKFYNEDGKVVSDSLLDLFRREVIGSGGYLSAEQWSSAMELTKKTVKPEINIADAKDLISKMSMKSYSGGYKCVIIWQAERMNIKCANALLKLFEEPAEKTLFIFVAHNREMILKTILSRVQDIYIPPIDTVSMVEYIAKIGVSEDISREKLLRVSQGNLKLLKMALSREQQQNINYEQFSSLMRKCYTQSYVDLIDWGEGVSKGDTDSIISFLEYSTAMCRDSYMKTIGMDHISLSSGDDDKFLQKFHPYIHNQNIEELIKEFDRASMEIVRNGNKRIILVHMALSISKLIRLPK